MEYDYYGNSYGSSVGAGLEVILGILIFVYVITLAVGIFTIICNWKVYKKAGKNGWEAIIPIYNTVVLIEIASLPLWYIVLFFVPFANIYVVFKIYIELAKKFGQSAGFGIGLVFFNPIFMAILAFGKKYVYQGGLVNNNVVYNQQPIYNNQPINNSMYNGQSYQQNVQPVVMPTVEPVQSAIEPIVEPVQPVIQPQMAQNNACSKCGSPVNPGDRFCMNCGNQL